MSARLGVWAGFAAVISAAGLPIYIHAPKVYADAYGVNLAALGAVLAGLRLLDVVQDPLLGRLAVWSQARRGLAVALAGAVMAAGMAGLFAVPPLLPPLWWFALMLTAVFSAFSFLTIAFYASGVGKAGVLGGQGHLRLARWREAGALCGICLAALLPTLLGALGLPAFAGFAVVFALAVFVAVMAMRGEWAYGGAVPAGGFGPVLRDSVARRLLLVALVNAAPVAVSSTLFLFFVESVLQAPGLEGPLLLLFFLSAAVAAPVWGLLAERFGAKRVLLSAMVLAVAAFGWALGLGAGDTWAFAVICLASGAALGADMTLLPALFARRMAEIAPGAGEGFALWSFVSKATLALAAAVLLPLLELGGFRSGAENDAGALWLLGALYAGVPCALKLLAIALLAVSRVDDGNQARVAPVP